MPLRKLSLRSLSAGLIGVCLAISLVAGIGTAESPTPSNIKAASSPATAPASAPASGPAVWPDPDIRREAAEYQRLLEHLTCPRAEGRGPGTPGIDFARDFIVDEMKADGLKPGLGQTYFQTFQTNLYMQCNEQSLAILGKDDKPTVEGKAGESFNAVGVSGDGSFSGGVVFAGYGIVDPSRKYDSYAHADGQDVSGKAVVIFRYEPVDERGQSVWARGDGWTENSSLLGKALQAQKQGAAAVLVVDPPSHKTQFMSLRLTSRHTRATIPVLHISQDFFGRMLAAGMKKPPTPAELQQAANSGKTALVELPDVRVRVSCRLAPLTAKLDNVVGVLPGSGDLAGQVLVIGGHYDHLGRGPSPYGRPASRPSDGDCYWGADDNASGTSGMLTMARWLTTRARQDAGPRRTIVFAAFSGEELGLLGSRNMMEHLAELGLAREQIVAMLNLDMIGRLREGRLAIFGVDSGGQWRAMIASAHVSEGLHLQLGSSGNGPSDHATFFASGIPVLHFFTGMHADVHTPGDTAEKINCKGAVAVADLACQMADRVIHDPKRIVFGGKADGAGDVARRPSLGVTLADSDGGEKGCRIDGVRAGGPAQQAGMKAGDVITGWENSLIGSSGDLFTLLDAAKPGQTVKLAITREGKAMVVSVVLGRK